ncbi:PEPxxWA-CTERM sorting domain-containing protein [Parasphingorhabdus marina]|uniref:PEPxxWA-CTERM sorting domain-containing protein n=1 Tax=Parasphingorhabdus marina TaxID=394732 RepID=UPI000940EF58|nr:PEPxxWA-CTERM sorting domain-containing protein [Parasphingorhabdus marina]
MRFFSKPSPSVNVVSNLSFDLGAFRRVGVHRDLNGRGVLTVTNTNPAPAIPEPSTWAMLILGFGTVGSSLRRRKTRLQLGYS